MRFLEAFDYVTLVDTLSEYTARYSKLLAEGGKDNDIINCRQTIQVILSEIEERKQRQALKDPSSRPR